jgi:hypothetical protein
VRLAALFAAAATARAHRPITTAVTWNQDIAPIFAGHCMSCHAPGKVSFPLTTFAEARPWAKAIRDEVSERRMPPWPAARGVGDFANDRSLPPAVVELIIAWAEGGAPEGNEPRPGPRSPEARDPERWPTLARYRPKPDERLIAIRAEEALSPASRILAVEPWARPGEPVQVQLVLEAGDCEPLVYIARFDPKSAYTYWLREPISAGPGARLEVLPKGARAKVLVARR